MRRRPFLTATLAGVVVGSLLATVVLFGLIGDGPRLHEWGAVSIERGQIVRVDFDIVECASSDVKVVPGTRRSLVVTLRMHDERAFWQTFACAMALRMVQTTVVLPYSTSVTAIIDGASGRRFALRRAGSCDVLATPDFWRLPASCRS